MGLVHPSTAFDKNADALREFSPGASRHPLPGRRGTEFLGRTTLSLWEREGPRSGGEGLRYVESISEESD